MDGHGTSKMKVNCNEGLFIDGKGPYAIVMKAIGKALIIFYTLSVSVYHFLGFIHSSSSWNLVQTQFIK